MACVLAASGPSTNLLLTPCCTCSALAALASGEAAGAGGTGGAHAAPVSLAWADVCQWVLGRPAPLWPLLFEQPLLERAKQLVEQDFSAVVDEVAELLGAALQVRGGTEAAWGDGVAAARLHGRWRCCTAQQRDVLGRSVLPRRGLLSTPFPLACA